MFSDFFAKVGSFMGHHQMLVGALVAFFLITSTWGIEKLMETYLFPNKPIVGFFVAALGGVIGLWLLQHYVLHII